MDLKQMSRKELTKLRDKIDAALEALKKKELKTAREAAAKAAAAHGFSLEELTGTAKARKKTGPKTKAPAKYRNPADDSQTWTGKGRQPQWFKDAMAAGKSPEALEI